MRPIFPACTWEPEFDLGYISFFGRELSKKLYSHAVEVQVEGLGRLIIDVGINEEILGIESLNATKHFPKWVIAQAQILGKYPNK